MPPCGTSTRGLGLRQGPWTGEHTCRSTDLPLTRWGCGACALTPPPRCLAPCPQLFNIYPWLGAHLQLHRPILRKVEAVRAILRTLLEARRPPAPGRGPVRSYLDALIQQGQVWARPTPPPKRPGGHPGPHPGGEGLGREPCWPYAILLHLLAGGGPL